MRETLDLALPDDGEPFRNLGGIEKREEHTSTTCLLETIPDTIPTRSPPLGSMTFSAKDGANGHRHSGRLGWVLQGTRRTSRE